MIELVRNPQSNMRPNAGASNESVTHRLGSRSIDPKHALATTPANWWVAPPTRADWHE
jgi:hypothetical protein